MRSNSSDDCHAAMDRVRSQTRLARSRHDLECEIAAMSASNLAAWPIGFRNVPRIAASSPTARTPAIDSNPIAGPAKPIAIRQSIIAIARATYPDAMQKAPIPTTLSALFQKLFVSALCPASVDHYFPVENSARPRPFRAPYSTFFRRISLPRSSVLSTIWNLKGFPPLPALVSCVTGRLAQVM